MESVWDFVAEYYPGYYQCDEIAYNDDLHKIVDGEFTEDCTAYNIYKEVMLELDGAPERVIEEKFRYMKAESDAYVFEKAIEGYIEKLKQKV